MWLSSMVASTLVMMALAAGPEYLPPNKGYNYEPPAVPFNPNGNKQPTPIPNRPAPTTRPSYIPPSPGPSHGPTHTPGAPTENHHQGGYDYRPNDSHDHHEHHDHHDHHHEPGMPFDFAYQVAEDGNDYSHNAISDGDVTRGEYRVALPDGRTQIVKYTADWKNGFNAEVTYEGEAKYPDEPVGGYGNKGSSGGSSGGQAYIPPSQGGGYQY